MRHLGLGLAVLLLAAAPARAETPAETLASLAQLSDLDRFDALRALDRTNDSTVRRLHDRLDEAGRARLLLLAKSAGEAATRAGRQQLGVISDVDDTAVPTDFTPDGAFAYKDAAELYRRLVLGTDGQGDAGNLHYVSARLPVLFAGTMTRLEAAGMPLGSFDGDEDPLKFLFGGGDGIQESKIEDVDLWLRLHPGQRFVLLGDTRQRDPEVYKWVIDNHPDQVEAVLIHRAGGPARDPAAFKGEVFFDSYKDAAKIVKELGVARPGALLADRAPDLFGLPLPDTRPAKGDNFFERIGNFFKANVGGLFHRPRKAPVPAEPPRTQGLSDALSRSAARGPAARRE